MQDMIGQEVSIGDYVSDSRGNLYQILQSELTFAELRLSSAQPIRWLKTVALPSGLPTYVRLYHMLLVAPGPVPEMIKQYRRASEENSTQLKREILERKKTLHLRLQELGIRTK